MDAREVLRDLRDHIEKELSGRAQPVSEQDVREVLARLGPPEQVVGDEELSFWRRLVLRLGTGPEDWRLAYVSLGVLVVFVGPLGIAASFLLSRAAISFAGEPDPPAKKWLLYPSLLIVYGLIGLVGLLWPAYALGGLVAELSDHASLLQKAPSFDKHGPGTVLAILAGGALGLSVWWSVLWVAARRRPLLVKGLFRPFADGWTGRAFGKAVLAIWAVAISLVAACLLWLLT